MKSTYLGLLILLTSLLASCVNNNEKIEKNKLLVDSLKPERFIASYFPSKIDIYKEINDTLNTLNFSNYFSKLNDLQKYELSKTLLLKTYLFHLKESNQGYDIKPMRKGAIKLIIDNFIQNNKIDTSDFSNAQSRIDSGDIYEIEKIKKQKNKINDSLIKQIAIEKERIKTYYDSILNKE